MILNVIKYKKNYLLIYKKKSKNTFKKYYLFFTIIIQYFYIKIIMGYTFSTLSLSQSFIKSNTIYPKNNSCNNLTSTLKLQNLSQQKKNKRKRSRLETFQIIYRWYCNKKRKLPANNICPITHYRIQSLNSYFDLISNNCICKRYDANSLAKHFTLEILASRFPQHPENRCVIDSITLKRLQKYTNTEVYNAAIELAVSKIMIIIDLRITYFVHQIKSALQLCAIYQNNIDNMLADELGQKPIIQLIRLSLIAEYIHKNTLKRICKMLILVVRNNISKNHADNKNHNNITNTQFESTCLSSVYFLFDMLEDLMTNKDNKQKNIKFNINYYQPQNEKLSVSPRNIQQPNNHNNLSNKIICRVNLSMINNQSIFSYNNNKIALNSKFLIHNKKKNIMYKCLPFTWDFYL